jgi:hypothetical protein
MAHYVYHAYTEFKSNWGTTYTFNERMAKELGYKKFHYLSSFEGGVEHEEFVYCRNEKDFKSLLDEWNSQIGNWLYGENKGKKKKRVPKVELPSDVSIENIKVDVGGELLNIEKVLNENNEIVIVIPASSLERRL